MEKRRFYISLNIIFIKYSKVRQLLEKSQKKMNKIFLKSTK